MQTVKILNLTKSFGKIRAVDSLSLDIEKGKITGLIGADGSGKTTLIRLITGLLIPDGGEITVLGLNPAAQKEELSTKIGYMPQKFGLYEDLSIEENLQLYADLKKLPYEFDELLEFTKLMPFKTRLAGALSGGMKQKLGLACALMGSPDFLVLDEPSVGVDPISRHDLMEMVRKLITPDTTVLWSTAYLDEAHSFDTAVVLDKGKVIYNGKPDDLARDTKEFEEKVIDLMGGYKKEPSKVAQNYVIQESNLSCTVEADNLEKRYGNFYAVKNNSFCIQRGEIFGLLGPNGAGKSTSFKMMCGLAKPTGGTAKIMGIDILENPSKARSNLGYMAQKFSLYGNLTLRQNLEFFASVYGINFLNKDKRVDEIIDIFNFHDIQDMKSQDLPLGFKQRLSLACAVIHNPPILFLDEPTSGVDVIARREFWNHITSLAKLGVTILVTTHFMDEAEYCNRISLFYKGETIALGTPYELKTKANADNMEQAFVNLIKESGK
ncbi:TPA: multidrug ABC transporter ATP-binding protein [Candidatus Gastranaerophilales bacterium HUM_13]|jgi:ABC-type multidrug transport system ATPase subunit|nr:ABC transporter ATP-binding protein [Acinetobacter sp.]DAB00842.1 MAG TPA: multidrug ABC transporter ATP-binding protein [Candidatus Gastranaerophilales bacterium HUM_11]DAB02504.1 MAG TPA: multidrug ABC transporter ATP-binding protein [Candidatus Gastranaerophilales bacterium HUM_10]DAB07096.1 MAG TPA: multidrug ABC transporter ATP-binding protein [Candidatus Gastranaerophilales bacterium HUM_13]DAB11604.1 MAG TPA: multidrug ABC transporter ATP-binding protein [Candidatus Gastranaerophilale